MATRFYLPTSTTAPIQCAPDAGWTLPSSKNWLTHRLFVKGTELVKTALTATASITWAGTSTQDLLIAQFISDQLADQAFDTTQTISYVSRVLEAGASDNAVLDIVLRVVDASGLNVRGTLYSNLTVGADTEWPTSVATRILNAVTFTNNVTAQAGDRLVLEVGAFLTTPAGGDNVKITLGSNNAADFALTTALTTNLNPWMELSANVLWLGGSRHPNNLRPSIFVPGLAR